MTPEWLAAAFEEQRTRLQTVALRLLGSKADAEDAVQEAWLRLDRSDPAELENLPGWLTTVVARISLDILRTRATRREAHSGEEEIRLLTAPDQHVDVELVDSVGTALMVVLDRLSPPERFAFVLHDIFGVTFEELGAILHRTPNATKQLASRARNKVRGAEASTPGDRDRQRHVVDAFLAASRGGDFDALLSVLHPDVKLDVDPAAVRMGAPQRAEGAPAVAAVFSGRALAAEAALVDGSVGLAWMVNGQPRVVWNVFVDGSQIVHIDMHADLDTIAKLAVAPV